MKPIRRRRPQPSRAPLIVGLVAAVAILVAGAVGVAAYLRKPPDARLIGTWLSDADATIAAHKKAQTVTDAQEQALRKLFGKMKVTYTAKTITTDLDGVGDTQPYRVVSKDAESVVVTSYNALTKKDEQFRIRFEGADTYWIDVEGFNLSERFRRVR